MTITIYLERKNLIKDLQSIYIICRDSDLIMTNKESLNIYKSLHKINGKLYSEKKENTLQLNISLSDYTTLCYFNMEQI